MPETIRIFIADDHAIVREGLRAAASIRSGRRFEGVRLVYLHPRQVADLAREHVPSAGELLLLGEQGGAGPEPRLAAHNTVRLGGCGLGAHGWTPLMRVRRWMCATSEYMPILEYVKHGG